MNFKIKERLVRLYRNIALSFEDFRRTLNWYLGGKNRYLKEFDSIVSNYKWVFIVGCNNSGTTILQRLLCSSHEITTFEMEGQRYTTVIPRAYKKHFERVWTEYANELVMKGGPSLNQKARLCHDWLEELDHPTSAIILEKTPANALRMEWLQDCFPNSYFIGLVRNGYAVVEGIHRKGKKPVSRAARHWAKVNQLMLDSANKLDHYLEVKYEDLVEKPTEMAETLAAFLGIDAKPLIDGSKQSFYFNSLAGKGEQKLRNFNAESIERLSDEDIESINAECKQVLHSLNYPVELR